MSGPPDAGGRRSIEEALAEKEELYRAVVEQIAEAIWIFDADSKRVLESNATFRELLGYTAEDLAGMTNYDFVAHDRGSVDRTVGRMAEERRGEPQERRYRRKDGTLVPVEVNGARVAYRGGEAICAVARDLTGRRRAEEALRESERRFRTLVQNASDVITLLRADGTIVYDSPAIEKVLGYGPEERVGESTFKYIHEDDAEGARATFGDAVDAGGAQPAVALRVRHKDGSWRHLEVTRANLLDDPTVGAIVANSRDVTEREEAHRALEKSEARFRSVVQNSSEIIKIVDPDGTLKYASPSLGRLLGYDPEALAGTNVLDHVHPEDLPRIAAETERAMATGGVARNVSEYRYRHADGSWRHMEASGVYLLDDPAVRGVVINARDVTGRRRAEEALGEAEEKFRSIFEGAAEGIYQTTPDGRFIDVNPAMARLFGYDSPAAMISSVTDIGRQLYADADRRRQFVKLARENDAVIEFESRIRRKDGSVAWVSENARAVRGPDGALLRYEGFFEDITGRKEAEEALRESERRFKSLVQNSSDVTAVVGADGVTRYASPSIERVLGRKAGDRVGKDALDHVHEDDVERVRGMLADLAADPGATATGRFRIYHADGGVRHVEAVGTNLLDDPGVGGVVINYRDVTGRRQAEEALRESEERFRGAFEDAPLGVALVGLDRRYLRTNRAMSEMLGYSEAELRTMTSAEITHPDDLAKSATRLRRVLDGGIGSQTLEKRYVCADGKVVWALSSISLVRDSGSEPSHFVSLYQDITGRKRAEEALRESEEFRRAVIERSVEAIYLFDPHTKEVLETNAAFERLIGYTGGELLGMRIYEFLAHEKENVDLHVERHLIQEGRFVGERRYRRRDGRVVDVAASATLVSRHGEEVVCVVVRDVSERKTLEEQLRHQALHDSLTGLPNRVLLLDRLGQALARADRSGRPVSALFVDLDNFKKINDSLGHEAGNAVLGKVAERLRGCVRPGDTVARLFGDEFAVLLEAPAGVDDARRVAERIMEVLGRPIGFDGQEVFTGCSIGIALNDTAGDRPADVLRRADLAMYAAKGRGKDSYEVYNPSMNTSALRRMELENDLRRAVEREEFEVHYQPIFRTSTGEVARVEALTRWRHPERGWIDPEDFIGLAEQTGLVRPLGRLVLEMACRQAKAWRERFPERDLKVSVNFSASQFDRQADAVPMTLSKVGLPPEALQLEITERAVMSNAEFALGKLQRLKDLGVGFAIDDYGTGYSCLYYLKRMPVNCLKIDRTFVAGLGRDRGDTAIVSGTIDLAHALGLEVVAEGVETKEQLDKLRELGCDMAQGFFLSVPLRSGDIPNLLAR